MLIIGCIDCCLGGLLISCLLMGLFRLVTVEIELLGGCFICQRCFEVVCFDCCLFVWLRFACLVMVLFAIVLLDACGLLVIFWC